MIWHVCPECHKELEELISLDSEGTPDETPVCPNCKTVMEMVKDFNRKVHEDGNKYRHVSWSLWNAGG